jgi:hypothetical protein
MDLAAAAENLRAISAELKAENARPLAIHTPSPTARIESLVRALEHAMGEDTAPTDVLQALTIVCGKRKTQWLREGYVAGSEMYEHAETMIDCLASDLIGDYIGEPCDMNAPDYFEVRGRLA